jgi:hypothetical protein
MKMRALLILCSSVAAASLRAAVRELPALPVSVVVSASGAFSVSVNGGATYFSSSSTYVRSGGRLYTTADSSLILASPPSLPAAGSDTLGPFMRQEMTWDVGGEAVFVTAVRVYSSAGIAVFEQSFPGGINGTAAPGNDAADAVTSAWPSFAIDASDTDRAVVGFGGRFLESSKVVAWGSAVDGLPSAGQHGGPMIVFDRYYSTSVVVSSFSRHTVATSSLDKTGSAAAVSYGLIGTVSSIPAGFSLETVIIATAGGPTAGAKRWGALLLDAAQITRPYDFTLEVLAYYTANGAYYYYKPETNKSFEKTLLDVLTDARARDIPYRYLQLDSWFYPKGEGGGVVDWNATANAFPDGLSAFHDKVGMPFYAHNRHWSAEAVYARQNGGDYDFIVEPSNKLAIPVEQRFWNDLLQNASAWGMIVYEQDWMFTEAEGLNATRESATLTDTWLTQMATAAAAVNATVQYCMSLGRFVMMGAVLPALTQFRAGDDYGPGQTKTCGFPYCVYYIGTTSLLGYALELAPSKDGFWSTEMQPGSAFPDATEPYAAMLAAVAAFSTAPVQLGDGIGFTNKTLVLAICTPSGRLLQPSRPMSTIDACFTAAAFGAGGPVAARNNVLPVQSSHTLVASRTWAHILCIGLAAPASIAPTDLPLDFVPTPGDAGALFYAGWREDGGGSFDAIGAFTADSPLKLAAAPDPHDWSLHHVAPLFQSGWAFLGEPAKLVPVSVWRILNVTDTGTGARVDVRGDAGEVVTLAFAEPNAARNAWTVMDLTCTLSASGDATFVVSSAGANCA